MVGDDPGVVTDLGEVDERSKGKREAEPPLNSPDAQRQMEMDIGYGASVRAACKAMRKRVPIEARRQKKPERASSQRFCLTVLSSR